MTIKVVDVRPYEGPLDEGMDPRSEEGIRYLLGKGAFATFKHFFDAAETCFEKGWLDASSLLCDAAQEALDKESVYASQQRRDKYTIPNTPAPRSEFVPSPKRVRALPWSGGRRWDR